MARISKSQKLRNMRKIASLYLRGKNQFEIAEEMGLSQSQISRYISGIHGEWLKSSIIDFSERKRQEVAKIDELERTYWAEWLLSRGLHETKMVEKLASGKPDESSKRYKESIKTEEVTGDKRYLDGVQWCIDKRCKIFGLEAPQKIAPTDPTGTMAYESAEYERSLSALADVLGTMLPEQSNEPQSGLDAAE